MPGRNPGHESTVRSLTWLPILDAIIHPVKNLLFVPFILLLLLAACSPSEAQLQPSTPSPIAELAAVEMIAATATLPPPEPSAPVPTTAVTGDAAPTTEPATLTPPPSPTSTAEPPQIISGQTAEGAFFLGDPAAPLTVIDYSDFL